MADQGLPEPEPGFKLAISISDSPDLARLGLTSTHLEMALGEVARAVLIASGRIVYGGHLDQAGYTAFLIHECEKFGSRNRPFTGAVPWPVHRQVPLAEIDRLRSTINLFGQYEFLDADGNVLDDPAQGRGPDPVDVDAETTVRGLTAMRQRVTDQADGRLVLGGKREGYQGRVPGVLEEAVLSIRAGKPIYVAGGFGGVAGDTAVVLGLDPDGWLKLPERPDDDFIELEALASSWDATTNGLSVEQNRQLAVSYRASEIASLVIVGLTNLRSAE